MQHTANDVSQINYNADPEGAVSANPGSICHDRVGGGLYIKETGTGNTGWSRATTSDSDLYTAKYIVNQTPDDGGNYTTIASAIAAASAAGGGTVFIRDGTYTENLTLKPGVPLVAWPASAYTAKVLITGNHTATDAGSYAISGINFLGQGGDLFTVSGTNTISLTIYDCFLVKTTEIDLFVISNANASVNVRGGSSSCNTVGITGIVRMSAGIFQMIGHRNVSSPAGTSQISGTANCQFFESKIDDKIITSNTAIIRMERTLQGLGTNCLVHNSTSSTSGNQNVCRFCRFGSGNADAIQIGAGATLTLELCDIDSNSDTGISGAGSLIYAGLTFAGINLKSNITTTTQTVASEGPSKTVRSSNSGGRNTLLISNTSNTASSEAVNEIRTGGATASDPFTFYAITGQQGWVSGIDNSDSDAYVISAGNVIGTANVMRAAVGGQINYPKQPAFLATNTLQSNVTGDGTVYTVTFETEIFDQGSDFASPTFTAPVTGRYILSILYYLNGLQSTHIGDFNFVTSNRFYSLFGMSIGVVRTGGSSIRLSSSQHVDMDAADTASVSITISGGTKSINFNAGLSYFGGSLQC
jgi:hypothetical protein